MRILITGANGQLGRALQRALQPGLANAEPFPHTRQHLSRFVMEHVRRQFCDLALSSTNLPVGPANAIRIATV